MPLPKILTNLIGGKVADIVEAGANVVDKFVQTKEEKEAAKLEMQKVVNEHLQVMEQELTKQLEIQAKENESARQREIQIATNENVSWITRNATTILALGFVGVTLILYILSVVKAVEIHQDILRDLRDIVILIMGYYFGSSLGSHYKQKQIDSMINK